MTTYTRNTLSGSLAPVNNELEKIEVSLREKLDRNPSVAQNNEMLDDLDMNSNRIINYPDAVNDSDLITKGQVASLAPVQSVDGQTGNVISKVQSVNGQTGNVSIPTQIQIDNGVVFDNIAEMKSSSLEIGQLVKCKRYYALGELVDGLEFEVVTGGTGVDDGGSFHDLANSNQVELIQKDSVNVKHFGVIGDGLANETVRLNKSFVYGRSSGAVVNGNFGDLYKVTDTIVINCDANLLGTRALVDYGFNKPVIKTSSTLAGVNLLLDFNIKYPQVVCNRQVGVQEPVVGSYGIELEGVRNCTLHIDSISGFDAGVLFYANDVNKYISYNQIFYHGTITGNKRNLYFLQEGTGWINQCTHNGGQFGQFNADAVLYDAVNLDYVKTETFGNNPPNGHTFIGCSMEGDFFRTIRQTYANTNSFFSSNTYVNCRFELATRMQFSPLAIGETFIGCYEVSRVDFIGGTRPIMMGSRSFNFTNESSPASGSIDRRTSNKVPRFDATNTGTALAISASFSGLVNGGITASGVFEGYSSGNEDLIHPQVQAGSLGSLPTITLGDGSSAPTEFIKRFTTEDWRVNFNLQPFTTNTYNLGSGTRIYSNVFTNAIRVSPSNILWTSGAGEPEGVVSAAIGSMYTRTDGGAGTTLYVKESGAGNTGWVAK
jgi:hypothetical protein